MVLLQQMQTIAYRRPSGIAIAVNRGEVHLLRRPRLDIKRQTKVEKTHAPRGGNTAIILLSLRA